MEGGHGVARILEVGAEYIRLAADQRDLSGLFLYGLILLRVSSFLYEIKKKLPIFV